MNNTVEFVALSRDEALALAEQPLSESMLARAAMIRDQGFGANMTYSRKLFLPLTHLCRDVCHYCTFAQTPKHIPAPYMTEEQVLASARQGAAAGCKEALFTLGERPELRYKAAREALQAMGFATTLEYVAHIAGRVLAETGLLPHINAGCMSAEEIAMLRPVSASMGIMLESAADRLCEKGMPHYGSPDKTPARRIDTIREAGIAKVPFTSGILIGIGETRRERIESLLVLRELHAEYGHLQEIIVQNFRAKPGTKMVNAPEPDLDDMLWTLAVARLIFGPQMSIQAPPNLSPGALPQLVGAGINDWGGVSPVTPDFVNPEAPWPEVTKLAQDTAAAGKHLEQRLTIYPDYALEPAQWLDPALHTAVLRLSDSNGFARNDGWLAGRSTDRPLQVNGGAITPELEAILAQAAAGERLSEDQIVTLFNVRGAEFDRVCEAADQLRAKTCGERVTYVVNRNINYTNICYFKCQFCAFSKGKLSENLRGRPYDLDADEIGRRVDEAWQRGATEVCMQGGIHPEYTGQTYLDILDNVKAVAPDIHVHAFTPLEVWQGAETLGLSVPEFLKQLKAHGLGTLPGTAAEILDDEVRAVICPDKINTAQWLEVMEHAHAIGLRSTVTIMFGHVDRPVHWARHLLRVRDLQEKTGGFTELVPLPFVASEAPIYLKGRARQGPTWREAVLMHAVPRLVMHGQINNIQASWVKMGPEGVMACLNAGANDVGGTLMNETITRAAGAEHGQEFGPQTLEAMIVAAGRLPEQRNTLYGKPDPEQLERSLIAAELSEIVNTPARKYERRAGKAKPVKPEISGVDADLIATSG